MCNVYVMFSSDTTQRDGIEYRILQTLSKKLNFTFDFSEPAGVDEYG